MQNINMAELNWLQEIAFSIPLGLLTLLSRLTSKTTEYWQPKHIREFGGDNDIFVPCGYFK